MAWLTDALADAGIPMLATAMGETVTYRPYGGTARVITQAIVDRNPPESVDGLDRGVSPRMVVTVPNSATLGVSSAECNTSVDLIDVSDRVGVAATSRNILNMRHDAASVVLELR